MRATFFSLAFIFFIDFSVIAFSQPVNVQDSLSLVDLYNGTNGSGWTNHKNWLTSQPVSNWFGITVADSRVTKIDMYFNNLSGTIPASIGKLENLTYLSLPNNLLLSSIPKEIGNLINLTTLNLSANQLKYTIPPEIGNLVNLTDLILSNNQFSTNIPSEFGKLAKLIHLSLYYNKFTGSIPPELAKLANLSELLLYNNQLSGSIPPELGNLVNLNRLSLSNNLLTGGIPPELGKLKNLCCLYLNDNNLNGGIPPEIGGIVNLIQLSLNNNTISGEIPSEIGNLENLEYLYLNKNELSGAIPASISGLPLIYSLDISYNRFTFDGMELIAQKIPYAKYSPQAIIPSHQIANSLSVSAGGTLINNTYNWFMAGQPDATSIAADSVFFPLQNGKYFAIITNSICTQLSLNTDTINYETTLPVSIINLKAVQKSSVVKVYWTSLSEINISGYELQRRSNADTFTTIGRLPAKNNGTQQQNYIFDDLQPYSGNNYYRLKIIGDDGNITYSNIVLENVRNIKTITVIYPIPAKDILHVQTNSSASFSLINQTGKILFTNYIKDSYSFIVRDLAAGLYYLRNNSSGSVQKVVVIK